MKAGGHRPLTEATLIGLGSNLPTRHHGGPVAVLDAAVATIAATIAEIVCRSRWFWSAAVPAAAQPLCVNGVLAIVSPLPPALLLARLHAVEEAFGRTRPAANAPRILDLDLLAMGDRIVRGMGGLVLPHPRLASRAFVLAPLAEILPEWRHPVTGVPVAALLAACSDQWRAPVGGELGRCKAGAIDYPAVHASRHGTRPMSDVSAPQPAAAAPAAARAPGPATDPASYAFFSRDIVRFSDIDRYRHINNVATATYCETGRVEFAEFLWPGSTSGDNDGWVIASLKVNFLAMAYYPGDVVVGSRVEHIGRTSCRLGQGLFKDGVCFATAEAVLVWVDMAVGGRPATIPPALVDKLRIHMT
jgi:2-amino-4-hydroxy-6-hydroxymethyldihydropteridine diphosphokinase